MSSIVWTIMSLAMTCSVRREISPCNCRSSGSTIKVMCENVESFNQVFDALQNRFNPEQKINLHISLSQLDDLETRTFADMNLRLQNLHMSFDQLKTVPESSFRNLTHLEYLNLSDNDLEEVPRHIFKHTPRLGTLDLGSQHIRRVGADDFSMLNRLGHLVIVSNHLTTIDQGAFPNTIRTLHLGYNNLTSLNGTLRELDHLEVLFLNHNNITSLEGELPIRGKRLSMILANYNQLLYIPQEFKTHPRLNSMYFTNNQLRSFDGVFRHSRMLEILQASRNSIDELASDEFEDCERMNLLYLEFNRIRSINGSMLPLKSIRTANFSNNELTEFSLNEIRGLRSLGILDLSHNRIEKLSGNMENTVEPDLFVLELRLEHNYLKRLDGATMGLSRLQSLNLSHNKLFYLSSDDLIGLDELKILDVSHNFLQTLEDTSKSFLPKLIDLNVAYNNLTKLDKDLYGLPVLCMVDLSHNQISSISPDLVTKTRCITHSTGVVSILNIKIDDNPILCQDELDEIINVIKEQDANLSGLGHCIFSTDFVPEPKPISVIVQVPNDLPKDELQPNTINDDINVVDLTSTTMLPTVEPIFPLKTSAHLLTDIPSTETPVLTLEPETLHFVSLETTTKIPHIVANLPQMGQTEPTERESAEPTEVSSLADTDVHLAETTTAIQESNELLTEPLPAVSNVVETAPNWTSVVDPMPVEPPPPEPIIDADDIKLI